MLCDSSRRELFSDVLKGKLKLTPPPPYSSSSLKKVQFCATSFFSN